MNHIISKQLKKGEYKNNPAENELLKIYHDMNLGDCDICKKCREALKCPGELSAPVSAWCIGNAFYEQTKRILFVGKTARSNPGKICDSIGDAFADTREFLWWETYDNNGKITAMPSAYWGYTAEITKRIFGIDSPEFISFTNMVKCNYSPDVDTTNNTMKNNCIKKHRVLMQEIKHIKPTHIIFYTGRSYDKYLPAVFDSYKIIKDETKLIGAYDMPWQEGIGSINDESYHVLRIGHPGMKKREDFVGSVVEWINSN